MYITWYMYLSIILESDKVFCILSAWFFLLGTFSFASERQLDDGRSAVGRLGSSASHQNQGLSPFEAERLFRGP